MTLLPPPRELMLFLTAALVLLLLPGPAVLYIVARSVDQGRRAGCASALGIATGALVHVFGAALGLSALLAASTAAYSTVKYAGAAYLVWLGWRKLRERPAETEPGPAFARVPLRRVYAHGVVVEALNPKVAIFFVAFLPQFVDPARGPVTLQFLALGLLFLTLGLVTDSLWALTAGSASQWLRSNRTFVRHQRYVAGSVYIGLGLVTAVSGARNSSRR